MGDGQSQPYINNIIWAGPANGAGLPATVAPIGRTESGLPIGVQIIGPYLEDSTPIQFAQLLEQAFGGFVPPVLEAGLEHRALPLLGPVVLGDRLLMLRSATRSWASPHDRSWRNKSVYLNR
jgi:Amidase